MGGGVEVLSGGLTAAAVPVEEGKGRRPPVAIATAVAAGRAAHVSDLVEPDAIDLVRVRVRVRVRAGARVRARPLLPLP